jgi:hypothetical protein
MIGTSTTTTLRTAAAWAWSLGLASVAFEFLRLPLLKWEVSLSYGFFVVAALLVIWAEKREFGTRVLLYRAHDALIYSPWKYLLLYFLWISVFSRFTPDPLASLLYAANGWLSLLAVGIAAQFIFCERSPRGPVLLPARLRLAFFAYGASVSLLLINSLLHLFVPWLPLPMLVNEQANLFLYFCLGLPFLLWDFIKDGRRLLPRWFSLLTVWMGTVVTLLLGRPFFQLALGVCLAGVLAMFFYKRIRPSRALLLGALVSGVSILLVAALTAYLGSEEEWSTALHAARDALEGKLRGRVSETISILVGTNFLGSGLGITQVRGVMPRVLAESGLLGFVLYLGFFLNLVWDL